MIPPISEAELKRESPKKFRKEVFGRPEAFVFVVLFVEIKGKVIWTLGGHRIGLMTKKVAKRKNSHAKIRRRPSNQCPRKN